MAAVAVVEEEGEEDSRCVHETERSRKHGWAAQRRELQMAEGPERRSISLMVQAEQVLVLVQVQEPTDFQAGRSVSLCR